MSDLNDPRVFFAAERTLLAWTRSGLAVMGMGFVVARFGLFLRLVRQGEHARPHAFSTWLGVALVVLGVLAMVAAAVQHLRFCRTLGPSERPPHYAPGLGLAFAFALAGAGAVLAVYLLMGMDGH